VESWQHTQALMIKYACAGSRLQQVVTSSSDSYDDEVMEICCHCHQCRNVFPIWALGLYRRLVLLRDDRSPAAAAAAAGGGGGSGSSREGQPPTGVSWLCAVSDFVKQHVTQS